MQRLEDKLPWPDRAGITHPDRLPLDKCAHDVWNELVLCEITAANYVPCPATGDNNSVPTVIRGIEVGLTKACHNQFRAGFAVRIRIVTPQCIAFTVTTHRVLVLVALIACHVHDGA